MKNAKHAQGEDVGKVIGKCDHLLKIGRAGEAVKLLRDINASKVPRKWRLDLARLCRRAGLASFGLRLLTPIVKEELGSSATPGELAEYAVLLQRFGAAREALGILARVDGSSIPDTHLYQAFCHFNLWQYDEAIPCLKAFLASGPSPYMELVGNVNLAASLVTVERHQEALELLHRNVLVAEREGYQRLLGNCLELLGQVHIHAGELSKAKERLETAASVFGSAQIHDQLFVRKWQSVLRALSTKSCDPLDAFRDEAARRGEPEAVRDTDVYRLKIEFDEKTFDHLIFGTPFVSYRERVTRLLGREQRKSTYLLGESNALRLDVVSGELSDGRQLSAGNKEHQLLEVLLRDFYRPLSLGEIFAELFPNEHFDIFSSIHRVEQVQHRLRLWITEQELPIEVQTLKSRCRLVPTGPIAFVVPLMREPVDPFRVRLSKLRQLFPDETGFTASQARDLVGLSPSEFKNFASQAMSVGALEKFGAAKATTYFVPNRRQADRAAS